MSYRFGRTRHEQSPATCAKELSINFSLPNYSHTNSKHSETMFSPTHHTTRDLVHENVVSSYHSSVHVTPAWGRIPHGFSIAWTSLSVSGEEFNVCLLWEFWSKRATAAAHFRQGRKKYTRARWLARATPSATYETRERTLYHHTPQPPRLPRIWPQCTILYRTISAFPETKPRKYLTGFLGPLQRPPLR